MSEPTSDPYSDVFTDMLEDAADIFDGEVSEAQARPCEAGGYDRFDHSPPSGDASGAF